LAICWCYLVVFDLVEAIGLAAVQAGFIALRGNSTVRVARGLARWPVGSVGCRSQMKLWERASALEPPAAG